MFVIKKYEIFLCCIFLIFLSFSFFFIYVQSRSHIYICSHLGDEQIFVTGYSFNSSFGFFLLFFENFLPVIVYIVIMNLKCSWLYCRFILTGRPAFLRLIDSMPNNSIKRNAWWSLIFSQRSQQYLYEKKRKLVIGKSRCQREILFIYFDEN